MIARRALPALFVAPAWATPALTQRLSPLEITAPEAAPLLARLRAGGHALFFRHADTAGEPCDRTYRIGDRAGQRYISQRGREQSVRIGQRLRELGVPLALPVQAGPVYRARDTAELAFGAENVVVTEGLLADDYAGSRLSWVLDRHRALLAEVPPPGLNRVLVGHRTPPIMIMGDAVAGRAFPEGGALVVEPRGAEGFRLHGIVEFAPLPGGGFHGC